MKVFFFVMALVLGVNDENRLRLYKCDLAGDFFIKRLSFAAINNFINSVNLVVLLKSANNCIKVGDELCRLPMNHKAKKSMPKVMRHEARYTACAYGSQIRSLSHLSRDKSHYDATRAYAISKVANVLHTKELARILQILNVDCLIVHPGLELLRGYSMLLTQIFANFRSW
ncbi:hypothetical protein L1887_14273 [Cichorium endivia]|nr:hypothetical protein L1887_14273 [Cichorium endivia]